MKTVLICGSGPAPAALRDLVRRGSTTFREQATAEVASGLLDDVDRVVFWTAGPDAALTALAERYAKAEQAERREALVFVAGDESALPPGGLTPNERYVWPRDEDRLRMAFLTGA